MKRIFILSTFIFVLFSILSSNVLAADSTDSGATAQKVAEVTQGALGGVADFLSSIFGPLFSEKEMLTKFFFAILLFMIIYSIVSSIFPNKKFVVITSSAIITILSVFFLPPEFITSIRESYGAMGAAILSVIPFVIMFIFTLKVGSALVARITWLFFIIYYIILYIYQIASSEATWLSAETLPYFGALIAGIIVFIFILPIRKMLIKGELDSVKEAGWEVIKREELLNDYEKKRVEGLSKGK